MPIGGGSGVSSTCGGTSGAGNAWGGGTGGRIVSRSMTGAGRLVSGDCAQDNAPAATTATMHARAIARAVLRNVDAEGMRTGTMDEGIETTEAAHGDNGTAARSMPGSLYVVATPLGNARDLTLRALDVLRTADLIAAEDTRVSAPLLRRYGVGARLVSMHEHNEARRAAEIIDALSAGRSVALVSDAGTPAISDPGARLVRAVLEAGYRVVPIPGPSAVTAAISAAGLGADGFVFAGFLPTRAKARDERIAALAALPLALVFYEAPHRVRATVAALDNAFAEPRTLIVARELTKAFETIARIPLSDAVSWLDADANRRRGEFVLIVDAPAAASAKPALPPSDVERWLRALLDELPPARAARVAATVSGTPRDELYALALALKRGG